MTTDSVNGAVTSTVDPSVLNGYLAEMATAKSLLDSIDVELNAAMVAQDFSALTGIASRRGEVTATITKLQGKIDRANGVKKAQKPAGSVLRKSGQATLISLVESILLDETNGLYAGLRAYQSVNPKNISVQFVPVVVDGVTYFNVTTKGGLPTGNVRASGGTRKPTEREMWTGKSIPESIIKTSTDGKRKGAYSRDVYTAFASKYGITIAWKAQTDIKARAESLATIVKGENLKAVKLPA